MEQASAESDVGAVLLRATFFTDEGEDFRPEHESLYDVAGAIATLARFLDGAFVLAEWDEPPGAPDVTIPMRISAAQSRSASSIEIVSISMNTPLAVILKIPAAVVLKLGVSAL